MCPKTCFDFHNTTIASISEYKAPQKVSKVAKWPKNWSYYCSSRTIMMISFCRAVQCSDDTYFCFPISGYICHGGWQEPLVQKPRSQNTFSKVQALRSTALDHLEGQSGGHYVVISPAETPHKRFCVRLIMDHDNSNVSLWANAQDCPRDKNEGQLWTFNLTRTSKKMS